MGKVVTRGFIPTHSLPKSEISFPFFVVFLGAPRVPYTCACRPCPNITFFPLPFAFSSYSVTGTSCKVLGQSVRPNASKAHSREEWERGEDGGGYEMRRPVLTGRGLGKGHVLLVGAREWVGRLKRHVFRVSESGFRRQWRWPLHIWRIRQGQVRRKSTNKVYIQSLNRVQALIVPAT
jgi:hypothetical protein